MAGAGIQKPFDQETTMSQTNDSGFSRRKLLQIAGGSLLAGMAPGMLRAQAPMKVRVAWQSSAQTASYLYAHTTNALKVAGLDVEHIKFSAGPPIFAALRSDS